MFAVFADGGRQYRVQKGNQLRVDYREAAKPGETIRFEEVLLAGAGGASSIGRPLISGGVVVAEVIDHEKGEKLEIGKHRRRKNSRRHTGHRQKYTAVRITAIDVPGIVDDTPVAEAAPPAEVTAPAVLAEGTPTA